MFVDLYNEYISCKLLFVNIHKCFLNIIYIFPTKLIVQLKCININDNFLYNAIFIIFINKKNTKVRRLMGESISNNISLDFPIIVFYG